MTVTSTPGCAFVIHFVHPASGLTLSYVAAAEGKVDLGTIAGRFLLDPNSVRFNGYFISRDAHFISSLTWRQLLSFFESRGFSSGRHALNPVRVEGNPLLQPPDEDTTAYRFEEAASNPEKPQSAKRTAVQADLSPFKRAKQEGTSGSLVSLLTPTMPSSKLKRGWHEDASTPCMLSKRIRHEVHPDVQPSPETFQVHEDNESAGSKRHASRDEVSTYRTLWKRMKEIRV